MSVTLKQAARQALETLEEIALAGMSGTGQESEDGMRDWHARQAWKFIGIAARALDPLRTAIQQAAQAEVQGEQFGYIHHFVAHDEHGALIDTTWEADGCADALPHPTQPAAWKWSHATPFYTTPQPAQAAQAEAKKETP